MWYNQSIFIHSEILVHLLNSSCQRYKWRHYPTARRITAGTHFGTRLRTENFKSLKNAPSRTVTFTLFDLKCRTWPTHIFEVTKLAAKTGEKNFGRATWEACSGNLESWEPSQHLLIDRGKPRKTCVEVAGRRTFRYWLIASSPASKVKTATHT